MPQSLALVLVHIIFSTKNRIAFTQSPDLRSEVHAYLTATLRGLRCEPLRVGGLGDHVHILAGLSRRISLAELVKSLKTSSTKIVKNKGYSHFSWQSGYGAFSVSQSAKESVICYIASQESLPSQDDIPGRVPIIAAKHSIAFDERYVWD